MKPFHEYATYYDLFYADKDYMSECDYLCRHIRRLQPEACTLLELGVGTGRHATHFRRLGFTVDGVDLSPGMLEKACETCKGLDGIELHLGDVRTIRLEKIYDTVMSLFHVASYQPTLEDLEALFMTARDHLQPGGSFLFDFWYAPAVQHLQPEPRTRMLRKEGLTITREAVPHHLPGQNRVDVEYTFRVEQPGMPVHSFSEIHRMRYFNLDEIDRSLSRAGFERLCAEEWLTAEPLNKTTWSACMIAKAL